MTNVAVAGVAQGVAPVAAVAVKEVVAVEAEGARGGGSPRGPGLWTKARGSTSVKSSATFRPVTNKVCGDGA
jgi:hypothetical protein